jgi:hypothetical protein
MAGETPADGEESGFCELPDGADPVSYDGQTGSAQSSELPDGADPAGDTSRAAGDQFSELPDQREGPSQATDQPVDSTQDQPQEAAEAGDGSQ